MPGGIELATAYLTLIPSLKGASKSINQQLSGVDLSKSGTSIGKTLSDGLSKGVSADSVKVLERAVTSAEGAVSDALYRSEQATKRVEVAQKRLSEARERYGDDSSQAAQAELNLMNAQHRSEVAGRDLEQAQERLDAATRAADEAARSQATGLERLAASAQDAGRRVQSAGKRLEGFGKSVADVGDGITSHVTVPLAGAAVGVGAFALSTASAAETSEMAFTTMLGSADEAREMMGELADFAAHTPFELSGLTTATQQLMAYGFTAEDVIPMLTAVGDATAALGTGQAGIESVTRALGQMQTRGKVSAEEMLQLTEAGIPAWEYLAEAIGTDTAGAMEAVSSGAVDAQTGIDALTAGMERDFGGMMESQSKTVAGLMSNLSDAIQQPLMELRDSRAYEAFASALGKVVDAAGPFVESLLPHLEDGLSVVADVLGAAADAMDGFAGMGYEAQSDLIGLVTTVAGAGPVLSVLGRGAQGAGKLVHGLGKATETAGKLVGKLPGPLGQAVSALSGAAPAASGMAGGLGAVASAALPLAAAGAAAGVVIGAIATTAAEAAEHERLLGEATMSAGDIMQQASAQATGLGGSLDMVADSAEPALQSLANLNQTTVDTLSDVEVQGSTLDAYVGTIEELAGQSNLTASEQERLRQAVEGYNEMTGESVEVTDAANGKLSEGTDEIRKNAEAWKANAEAQAYSNVATEYLEEQIRLEQQLAEAQDKYAEMQQRRQELIDKGSERTQAESEELAALGDEYTGQIAEQKQAVADLSEAYDTASENAEGMSNAAMAAAAVLDEDLKAALQDLAPEIQDTGTDLATALQEGIDDGSVNAEAAVKLMGSEMVDVLDSMPQDMRAQGTAAARGLAQAVSEGKLTADQAAQVLKAAVTGRVDDLPPELQGYGRDAANQLGTSMKGRRGTVVDAANSLFSGAADKLKALPGTASTQGTKGGSNFASAIRGQYGAVGSAASALASAAKKMGKGDSYSWGSHLAGNFARGLRSNISAVAGAAAALMSAAKRNMGFTVPEDGPWSGRERGGFTSGLHLAENFADGMLAGTGSVSDAAEAVARAAAPEWPGTPAATRTAGRYAAAPAAAVTDELLAELLRRLPSIIRDNAPSTMTVDGREFARAVRRVVPA